jgi:uncharacterized membrane protein
LVKLLEDAVAEDLAPAKRPTTVLAGPYGHPLHPALIPIPIGAWFGAAVFDVGSHVADDPAFLVRGAYWLIAIGVLGALAAALVGFLDLLALPSGTRVQRVALAHMGVNLAATTAFAVDYLLRRSRLDDPDVSWGLVALTCGALALLAVGGALGGELAYRFGVRVADEDTQRTGFRRSPQGN